MFMKIKLMKVLYEILKLYISGTKLEIGIPAKIWTYSFSVITKEIGLEN